MPRRCTAKKADDKPCGAWALKGKAKCALHMDPERAAQMGAKHGRKSQMLAEADASGDSESQTSNDAPKTVGHVRDVLAQALVQVRLRRLDTRTANAMAYVASSLLRAIEIADLEARLDKVEVLPVMEKSRDQA